MELIQFSCVLYEEQNNICLKRKVKMKKILIVLLSLILLMGAFAGCQTQSDTTESTTDEPTSQPTEKPTLEPTEEPTEEPTQEPVDEAAQISSLEVMISNMYADVSFELPMLLNTPITRETMTYYFGTDDFEFLAGVASEPMISSVPFSVSLIKVADDADIQGIMTKIKENVDPAKWICVRVEEDNVVLDNKANIIVLIMSENSEELQEKFKNLD